MATYTKTERFFRKEVEIVADILRTRGFAEEWSIFTPYQTEIKMYHKIKNRFAILHKEGNNVVVNYSK